MHLALPVQHRHKYQKQQIGEYHLGTKIRFKSQCWLSIGKTTKKFVLFHWPQFFKSWRALFNHHAVESRLSLIVRVNVVLTRTVAVDSDWRFDNLCGCHLQKEYVQLDDQTQPTFEMTPGFKPFTVLLCSGYANALFTGKRFILWIVSSTFGPTGTWTAKQAI